jgi:hypothetical protein
MTALNPGIYDLGDLQITAAGTQTTDWTTGLEGMVAATFQVALAYGSGGATAKAYIQTSLDQGATAIDIACVTFTTAGATRVLNLSALTPRTTELTPTDGALTDDTAIDGVLGDRLRVMLITTGTYAGSTVLGVRANVR